MLRTRVQASYTPRSPCEYVHREGIVEPPRTHVNDPYTLCFLRTEVVQEGLSAVEQLRTRASILHPSRICS